MESRSPFDRGRRAARMIAATLITLVAMTPNALGARTGQDQRAEDDERRVIVVRDGHHRPLVAHGLLPWGGFLGVQLVSLSPELRRHFGVSESAGVMVASVIEDSPAAKAGIEVADIVTAIDGTTVATPFELARQIAQRDDGDSVELEIWRDGAMQTLVATLEKGRRPWVDIRQFHLPEDLLETLESPALRLDREIEIDGEEIDRAVERLHQLLESPEWTTKIESFQEHQQGLMERLETLEHRLQELASQLEELSPGER